MATMWHKTIGCTMMRGLYTGVQRSLEEVMGQKMIWQCDCCNRSETTHISADPPDGFHIVELIEVGQRSAAKKYVWCSACFTFVIGSKDGKTTTLEPALSEAT